MKLEYIIFIVIFFIPTYLLRFSVFGIPTNALEIMVGVTFIAWLIDKIKNQNYNSKCKTPDYQLLVTGIALLSLGLCIGVFVSPSLTTSLGALKGWFVVPLLFSSILHTTIVGTKKKRAVFYAMLISGIVTAFLHLPLWIEGITSYDHRLAGIYNSPNALAMYLIPALLIALGFLRECLSNPFFQKKRKRAFYIALFTPPIALLSFIILQTKSKGAFLGFLGTIILFYLSTTYWGKHKEKLWKIIFIALFSAGLLLPFFSLLVNPWAMGRSSLTSRLIVWQVSSAILKDHWFFGIGPGTFQDVYLAYQKQFPPYLDWAVPHPHNIFLATWLYGGLLGVIGFLLILYWFFQKSFTLPSTLYPLSFLIILYLLVHGFIDNTLWRNDLGILFWLFVLV